MEHRKKRITVFKRTHRMTCNFCNKILWDIADKRNNEKRESYWEAWHCTGEEDLLSNREDVHICSECFNDAGEYLSGTKAQQREDNIENLSPKRKRFRSPE